MADSPSTDGMGRGAGPASRAFGRLRLKREPFLIRARRQARLTIPGLFREYGENQTTGETLPWQSLGAYGLNNLAARAVLGGFPPGMPNINIKADRKTLTQLLSRVAPEDQGQLKAHIDKGLSMVEQDYVQCCEEDGDRTVHFDTMRHLLAGGSHCIHMHPKTDKLQSIPLEQHVVRRDASGTVLEAVVEVPMEFESLPPDCQELAMRGGYNVKAAEDGGTPIADSYSANRDNLEPGGRPISVFTHIKLQDGKYVTYQECWGQVVPDSHATWNVDVLPWLFIPLIRLRGEDYGRSYCEDYEGDLQAYDGFWQMLTEGIGAILRSIWLVKPGGVTNKQIFGDAQNGAVITGDPADVAMARAEKTPDFQQAMEIMLKIEQHLEKQFLIYTPRQGERVTQEEVRQTIQDLQQGAGGLFSNLGSSWFGPFTALKLAALQRHGRVQSLPKGTTRIKLLTGDAALGREIDAQTLDQFIATATTALGGAPAITPYISIGQYLVRGASNRGIDSDGLIKSDQQVQDAAQQERQQTQAEQLGQKVAPVAANQAGEMIQNMQTAGAAPQGAPQGQPASAPQPPPGA